MKKKGDPRHKLRVQIFKDLFENTFRSKHQPKSVQAAQILAKRKGIDKIITQNAPAWPIDQLAPADLATLRLAIWELLYKKPREPYKVIIDEAVEIAKEFGSESSGSFINGVLGTIISSQAERQTSK